MPVTETFYMIEIPDGGKFDSAWWVVGIFDNSDEAIKVFTQRKAKRDTVRLVECKVIMEHGT